MKFSLRTKLIALSVSTITFLVVAIFLAFDNTLKNAELRESGTFVGFRNTLNDLIGAQFYERYGDAQAFALNPVLHPNKNIADSIENLNQLVKLYGIYDLIVVADANGIVRAANTVDPKNNPIPSEKLKGMDVSNAEWFKMTKLGTLTEDKAKAFSGTLATDVEIDPLVSAVYGKPSLGNAFSAPIISSDGKFIGVISNRANFKWVEFEFESVYRQLKTHGHLAAALTLLDRSGRVLIDFDPASNGGNASIVRNLDILLKPLSVGIEKNQAQSSINEVFLEAKRGQSGVRDTLHMRKEVMQLTSFGQIDGPKFPTAIGWVALVQTDKENVVGYLEQGKNTFWLTSILGTLVCVLLATVFFHIVTSRLGLVTNEVQKLSSNLVSAGDEMNDLATTLAEANDQQRVAIEESSASIASLLSNANTTKLGAEEASAFVEKVTSNSIQCEKALAEMQSAMDDSSAAFDKVTELKSMVERIGQTMQTIDEIVTQTKLLSFNASVEAERAGEYGKGFSVVAQEIGNLANMSDKESSKILKLVKDTTKLAIDAENGTEGSRLIFKERLKKTSENIAILVKMVEQIANRTHTISDSIVEQSSGLGQISKAMSSIGDVTVSNSKGSETARLKAEDLNALADELNSNVNELIIVVKG